MITENARKLIKIKMEELFNAVPNDKENTGKAIGLIILTTDYEKNIDGNYITSSIKNVNDEFLYFAIKSLIDILGEKEDNFLNPKMYN